MAAVIGSILARLAVDASGMQRGLVIAGAEIRRFEAMAGRSASATERAMLRMSATSRVGMASLAKGALAAVAPIVTVGAALDGARRALADFDKIGKSAKAGGLDAETFQAFAYAAELGGVQVDQFSAAMQFLARNSGLAAAGQGELIAKLKQLNPELLRNILAAKDQESRVRLAADAIDAAGSASEKAALATALFGDSGAKLVEVFKGGSAALDETARKARALGIIVSGDLIARAEALNDEFTTASKVLDLQFKQALIDLAPVLIGTAQLAGTLAGAVRGLVDAFKGLEDKSTDALKGRLAEIQNLLSLAAPETATIDGKIVVTNPMVASASLADDQVAALEKERQQIEAILAARQEAATLPPIIGGDVGDDVGSRAAAAQAALGQADAVKALIADLEFERSLIGKSEAEQRALTAARQAGAAATNEQLAKIVELVKGIEAEKGSIAALQARMDAAQGVAKDFLSTLIGDVREGKTAVEALTDAFGRLSDRLLDMALDQAIASLFGNLTGLLFGGTGSTTGFYPGLTGPSLYADGGLVRGFADGGCTGPATLPEVRA